MCSAMAKQKLLEHHGIRGVATTQICFDSTKTISWLAQARAEGFRTPVRLGLTGVVDKKKLISLCGRLGIAQSLRFVANNQNTVAHLFSPGGYDPTSLLSEIAPHASSLNVQGIHCFTFNSTATTVTWVDAIIGNTKSK